MAALGSSSYRSTKTLLKRTLIELARRRERNGKEILLARSNIFYARCAGEPGISHLSAACCADVSTNTFSLKASQIITPPEAQRYGAIQSNGKKRIMECKLLNTHCRLHYQSTLTRFTVSRRAARKQFENVFYRNSIRNVFESVQMTLFIKNIHMTIRFIIPGAWRSSCGNTLRNELSICFRKMLLNATER